MTAFAYFILAAGFLFWVAPFFLAQRRRLKTAVTLDRRARWGILLQGISYAVLLQGNSWLRRPQDWRVLLSILFFALAGTLSWTSVRALGRQWRVDAGLNADHQLVRSGPYRLARHPIYTSMLCLLLGVGWMISPWPLLVLSMLLFLMGTEIRVHIEDTLLASRFDGEFQAYRRTVPAYIPFTRKLMPVE